MCRGAFSSGADMLFDGGYEILSTLEIKYVVKG
jgi:hypothetical protein